MSTLRQALEATVQKSDDLFAVQLSEDIEILFRLPTIVEAQKYKMLLSLCQTDIEQNEIYEFIFRHLITDSYLANNDPDLPAGVPATISQLALYLSGAKDTENYTEELWSIYREHKDDTITFMKTIICSVFAGYTFESLDSLNYQKLSYLFVQAEGLLIERGVIQTPYSFKTKEVVSPVRNINGIIDNDIKDFQRFDGPKQSDPRSAAIQSKLREAAIKRAEEEERKYMESHRRKG